MTEVYFNDLQALGRKVAKFTTDLRDLRAIVNGRMTLAKGLRNHYPNMTNDAIRTILWKQEQLQTRSAQLAFDEMRMYAVSLGWDIQYKDMRAEVAELTQNAPKLNDINV